jgi:large subunit ribosomal protein L9
MRVLLRSDVDGVGKRGDVVEVARGFARNYLLPSGRAMVAGEKVEAQAAAMRRVRDLRDAQDRDAAQTVAQLLTRAPVAVPARVGESGRLFGSVTAADVVEAIRSQTGATVDRRRVHLADPIKTVGAHVVAVHLHPDVDAEVTVEVVPEA